MKLNYTRQVGNESESFLCYISQRLGWGLSLPYATDLSYDFAIKRPGDRQWQKIQVKTSAPKRKKAGASVDIRKNNGKKYKKEDFDFLFAYNPKTLQAWMIPHWKLYKVRCEITPTLPKFNRYEVFY